MTQSTLIIIPTYNEKENIELLVPAIKRVLPTVHILIVDDSSPDGTHELATTLSQQYEGVHTLLRPQKQGLGPAYIAGFRWAIARDYAYICEMDADFSHDPSYLPAFLEEIAQCDLVVGSRYKNGVNVVNWPLGRLLLSWFANMVFTRVIAGLPFTDSTSGFKCFRKEVLTTIDLSKVNSSGYSFQIEMNYKAWKKGFSIREIPIVFHDRQRGKSKMSTKIVQEAIVILWRLRLASIFNRN